MVYQRIFQGVTMFFLAGATFAACESSEPQTPQQEYCSIKCNCNKCTPTESATCLDDMVNLEDQAGGADCIDPYETFVSCLIVDGVCTDGDFDESACFNEETDLKACIKPPPACATVEDGKCNEPMPAGDGTCATGSDTKDCTVPPCATTNNGICDEPEGTNTCAEGSDPIDCPAPKCLTCFEYLQNPEAGTLCATSSSKYSAVYDCACNNMKCATSCSGLDDLCSTKAASMMCRTCVGGFDAACTMAYQNCMMDNAAP
jgi:hypothetical protein